MAKHAQMSPQSQLLLRSIEHFESGTWAFINPSDADIFNEIDNPNLVGLHQYHHQFTNCERAASQPQFFGASFDLPSINKSALDGVVIYMPKSKQQLTLLIDMASSLVKQNAVVLIVGENKAGIKSVPSMLEKIGSQVNKIDSAKHCGLYAVTISEPKQSFNIDDYGITRTYNINGVELVVFSLPGVFGHKQLDPGTDLLLQQLTPKALAKAKGHIYDFACGSGVIACYLAKTLKEHDIRVSMSDVSGLAIYSSEKTAALNKLEANIIACDGVAQLNEKFDIVVANPPFHESIRHDYSITEKFIKQAFSQSKPYASITVVANRFLPYPDIFDSVYKGFVELAASNKYKVFAATKFSNK